MIDEATIKRVAEEKIGHRLSDDGKLFADCTPEDLVEFARTIEQLARQEQREEDARICEDVDTYGIGFPELLCARSIRASGKEKGNE